MLKTDAVALLSRILRRCAVWGTLVVAAVCLQQLPLWNGRCPPLAWVLPLAAWRLHGGTAACLVAAAVWYSGG